MRSYFIFSLKTSRRYYRIYRTKSNTEVISKLKKWATITGSNALESMLQADNVDCKFSANVKYSGPCQPIMYQSFFLYIIVILIYSARPESAPETFQAGESLLLMLTLFALFFWIVRKRCQTVQLSATGSNRKTLPARYDRLQLQLQIGAVIIFTGMVYGVDLGALIECLPLAKSEGVSNLLGLSTFFLLQIVIWRESHNQFVQDIFLIKPASAYIKARLRFALGLIVPWLSLLLIVDILNHLKPQLMTSLLKHPLGELTLFLAFLILFTVAAPPLLVRLWQCRKLPDSPLRQTITKLCQSQGVSCRQIMLWPTFEGRMATAAVVGAFPCSRYLLLTPDLIRLLNDEEIAAVTSHELGHVRYHHLLFFLFFFVSFFLFNLLYYELGIAWILTTTPVIALLESGFGNVKILLSLLKTFPLLILYLLFFRYIFGFFLRNFERQADLASLDPPGLTAELISAFTKLGFLLGQAGKKPNWHHFNIPQRIAFLETANSNPAVARSHHRYLKKSLALYVTIFILIILPGIYWQQTNMAEKLNYRHLTMRLEYMVQKEPDKPELWFLLSSLYIENNHETKALNALCKTRELSPDDPETLNNLAWLLLTIKNKRDRNYDLALNLAKRAATLKPEPHILDTLAEAYWHQGDAKTAVAIEAGILRDRLDLDKLEHYKKQLKKFRQNSP